MTDSWFGAATTARLRVEVGEPVPVLLRGGGAGP